MAYISAKLEAEYKKEMIVLLKEFKDCFAWEYYEMPSLDRSIVEHRLPIKTGVSPIPATPKAVYSKDLS
jgi:hypothetical protein